MMEAGWLAGSSGNQAGLVTARRAGGMCWKDSPTLRTVWHWMGQSPVQKSFKTNMRWVATSMVGFYFHRALWKQKSKCQLIKSRNVVEKSQNDEEKQSIYNAENKVGIYSGAMLWTWLLYVFVS